MHTHTHLRMHTHTHTCTHEGGKSDVTPTVPATNKNQENMHTKKKRKRYDSKQQQRKFHCLVAHGPELSYRQTAVVKSIYLARL